MALPPVRPLKEASAAAKKLFGSLIFPDQESDVSVIEISANLEIRETIRVGFEEQKTRLVVVVGKGAKAVIVEELRIANGELRNREIRHPPSAICSHAVEIFLEENSSLEFISLQAAEGGEMTILQRAEVGAGASISWRNVTLGATVSHDLESRVIGERGESSIDWMFYARDAETHKLRARNSFMGRYGEGEIVMKGVAEERAHVRCDGMIGIGPNGGQTDTYLTQDVLMLDPTSKVDAVPGLEIKTNDVKASHSATVSRVTDDDLFYFAARGIGQLDARKMFVEGFLEELLAGIGDVRIREEIAALVEAKYAKGRPSVYSPA